MPDLDIETILAAQSGDEDASRVILERLQRPVLATIYRFLGTRFRKDAEDIAQDIFLKVFRAIGRFDPERGVKFTTWVYTFVRNHCFDILKKRRLKTTSMSAAGEDGDSWDLPDEGVRQPDAHIVNDELGSAIREALGGLGDDQRMVFVLREYEGLDYASIAQVMGISQGTVKSRLHRAKETLRDRLQPYLRAGA